MTRLASIIASVATGLVLGGGIAFAQAPVPPPNMHEEILAAQDSLEEAMRHLDNIRGPGFPVFDRSYAFILLAHTELGPTFHTRGGGRDLPYK